MRLNIVRSAHSTSYSVIKSAYKNKKITSVVVERLGNDKQIREKYGVEDAEQWARAYVAELNKKEAEEKTAVSITFSPASSIPLDEQRSFNAGYLFLQQVFYQLGLDKICTAVKRKHSIEYNLTSILSRLVYTRILYPGSKRSSFEDSRKFIEQPDFDLHQVYRALSVLGKEAGYIQSALYKNSLKLSSRRTGVIYYDCTNFYFETEQEDDPDGLRQYGHSKENRPNPIVQMGLFMDADGIPLAFCINPGNTSEQLTLVPLEKRLTQDFSLSGFVVCTDAGLASTANRSFNDREGRAFITVQSVKALKAFQKEWCLDTDGWLLFGDASRKRYSIKDLDEENDRETTFYKERWFNENGLEQRMIVTYSLKYRDYLRSLRERHVVRAAKKLAQPSLLKHKRPTDPGRFIKEDRCTGDGELAEKAVYSLDEARISEEAKYDGFYAVCTDLEDDAETIVSINRRRWRIEECFRIMKHEFRARPAYLSRDERILAHFMTCFIALIVYRFLEKRLGDGHTVEKITDQLREMNMTKLEGYGYIPSYDRNELTEALHKSAGFRTDQEIIPIAKMRNICKNTKSHG